MKRFYNNTLMSGAFSKALRVVALLCVLLGISGNAWGAYYLHYNNTGSHTKDVGASDLKWTDGVEPVDDVCTWTISTSVWDNYVYIMSSKTNKTILDITGATISNNSTAIDFGNITNYNSKNLFYFKQKSAKASTITISYNISTKVITFSDGGAGGCTPSVSMVSAIFNGTQIEMKGNVTKSCGSAYRGFEYSTDGNNWMSTGGGNSANTGEYTGKWTPTKKGTTYFIRASYGNSKSSNTISVKIPAEGSESESCNVIEIYCKYLGASTQFDMKVHLGNDENDNSIHQGYASCDDSGNGYAHWTFNTDKTDVCIIISNKEENYKTPKMCGLSKGNKYYFDIPASNWNTWSSGPTKTETLNCETNVLLSREAIVNKSAKTAQLFGYLKATNCERYTDYGFYYCMVNDGDAPCTPSTSENQLAVSSTEELPRGKQFNATLNEIQDGKTYYYRAYAKSDKGTILSEEIRSFSTDPCIPQYGGLSDKYNGNPIVYTINADPAFTANDCKLHFNSLQAAIDHLKATNTKNKDFQYVTKSGDSYNLNQPVEMRVMFYDDQPDDEAEAFAYRGTTEYGMSAGDVKPANINLIKDINKTLADKDAKNTLTITTASKAKPWIHHPVIRNSRYIILDGLYITSDRNETKKDNAIEIDIDNESWPNVNALETDAHVVIQNCVIDSKGFTGIHISGYNGITLKGNDIEASFTDRTNEANILNWGASAKFLACKNIKFIQNNFRGSQPTLLWIQDSENALFMNNVFWNTNTYTTSGGVTPSAIRLVNQYGKTIQNISFFYNTFYFEENGTTGNNSKYNFFIKYSAAANESTTGPKYFGSNIYFQYNNCYSYDKDCPGSDAFYATGRGDGTGVTYVVNSGTTDDANFCPNNFWSVYDYDHDNTKSVFDFTTCNGSKFINVRNQVCSTSAMHPASLIVKGKEMNIGSEPNISSTGISLTDNESTSDRYLIGVRPKDNTWTYGAYQSKDAVETEVIYWVGFSDDWDDRGNWEYVDHNTSERLPVSCINNFSENLKAVIEETADIVGNRKWPKVPESFTTNRSNMQYGEHVSAGLGVINNPTKFASTIELEYGAGIKGVENLNDNGTLRYDRAIVHFDISGTDRNKWLLVGPVVKPFRSGNSGQTRDVISNDYFKNYEPHIYMHEITNKNGEISWNKTFGDLNIPVYPNTVFAIQASKDYGPYFDIAEDYKNSEGMTFDDTDPIQYTFTGRFAVEEGQHNTNGNYVYSLESGINLLNNVYPCNLNVQELENLGEVNLYDYDLGSFVGTTARDARVLAVVRSQNGFVFTPQSSDLTLELSQGLLTEGSTRTRSGEIVMPSFSLNIDNANTTKPGASNIVISYDEFLGSDESLRNTHKVFTKNTNTPEAYIVNKDNKYTRFVTGKEKISIPVDIRLKKPMNLTFEKVYNEGYSEVTLVDTKTMKYYNLLRRNYTTELLESGDIEGRFYLNLTINGDEDIEDSGNVGGDDLEEDDDVPTEVEEIIEEADINIYSVDNCIIKVIATGTTLKAIYVNDMAGRTEEFLVDGNFAELQLPVSSGVYTVHVIGDTATKIGKVILK